MTTFCMCQKKKQKLIQWTESQIAKEIFKIQFSEYDWLNMNHKQIRKCILARILDGLHLNIPSR